MHYVGMMLSQAGLAATACVHIFTLWERVLPEKPSYAL